MVCLPRTRVQRALLLQLGCCRLCTAVARSCRPHACQTLPPATPRLYLFVCLQVKRLHLGGNALSASAFPPAWQLPGAMRQLTHLELGGNPGLEGELPANLSWPSIEVL